MDNYIDPKITAILNQLEDMMNSVIGAGRSAADQDREGHAIIKALRCELELANDHNKALKITEDISCKITEASTISMIVGWLLAAICFTGWMLS